MRLSPYCTLHSDKLSLKRGGLYADLWERQSGGVDLALQASRHYPLSPGGEDVRPRLTAAGAAVKLCSSLADAVVSRLAELVRGTCLRTKAPSSALRAPSPQGEKGSRRLAQKNAWDAGTIYVVEHVRLHQPSTTTPKFERAEVLNRTAVGHARR